MIYQIDSLSNYSVSDVSEDVKEINSRALFVMRPENDIRSPALKITAVKRIVVDFSAENRNVTSEHTVLFSFKNDDFSSLCEEFKLVESKIDVVVTPVGNRLCFTFSGENYGPVALMISIFRKYLPEDMDFSLIYNEMKVIWPDFLAREEKL